ncbi:MAG: acetyl-CoA carboxylase biotin carboxyl carrier protein [Chitinophagaceae bacterium]|nr:MAG: acetyl-CoA carboxylase biotin carboxyl carrier protein [Chitinophagaceae bacterium]
MDFKEIQELIKLFGKSEISEISIKKEDFKIRLTKPDAFQNNQTVAYQPQQQIQAPAPVNKENPVSQESNENTTAAQEEKKAAEAAENNYITIKSPMIGTFYRASSPDKDPFVKVGDSISKGSVLCIIEAMKLFNEIESEFEGKIVKILIDDASPVEYEQPLFLIEPLKK